MFDRIHEGVLGPGAVRAAWCCAYVVLEKADGIARCEEVAEQQRRNDGGGALLWRAGGTRVLAGGGPVGLAASLRLSCLMRLPV